MARKPKGTKAGAPSQAGRRFAIDEAQRRLPLDQAAFELTRNPIYAWRAIDRCLRDEIDIPAWARHFLREVSGVFHWLTIPTDLSNEQRLGRVLKTLKMRQGGHLLKNYWETENALSWAAVVELTGAKQGAMIARIASKAGVTRKKAEELIARANKIRKRAARIRENQG